MKKIQYKLEMLVQTSQINFQLALVMQLGHEDMETLEVVLLYCKNGYSLGVFIALILESISVIRQKRCGKNIVSGDRRIVLIP